MAFLCLLCSRGFALFALSLDFEQDFGFLSLGVLALSFLVCGLSLCLLWIFFDSCSTVRRVMAPQHETVGFGHIFGFCAPRCCFRSHVRFVLLWTVVARIGEAHVPGPDAPPNWCIGTCNPAGVAGKAHLLDDRADIWLISESHLTKKGGRQFAHALRAAHSPFRWFVPGAPLPPRSVASALRFLEWGWGSQSMAHACCASCLG